MKDRKRRQLLRQAADRMQERIDRLRKETKEDRVERKKESIIDAIVDGSKYEAQYNPKTLAGQVVKDPRGVVYDVGPKGQLRARNKPRSRVKKLRELHQTKGGQNPNG
jgi:hypothetical protein